jgi:hypothetical protein
VFESWESVYDSDDEQWDYYNVLSVYQMLPYDGIPKVTLRLSDSWGWWDWMGDTPFQISKGYLYYTETEEVAFYGNRDVIRTVKLSDRTPGTLLGAEGERYEIYSWRLSGDTLHFSALDLVTTTVVTGEIDTAGVRAGDTADEYMTITETASAIGASSAVQDIEPLVPQQAVTDTGGAPQVMEFFTSPENLYSVSMDFSKYMDRESVEDNLTFTVTAEPAAMSAAAVGDEVDNMKIWIYKSLHLIPDQSDMGLGDAETDPLSAGTTYNVAVGADTLDAFGWEITGTTSDSFTTKPDKGWYSGTTDDSSGVHSSGDSAKYAGGERDSYGWYMGKETYDLLPTDAVGGNLRVEFAGKNFGWDGVNVLLWNQTNFGDATDAGDTNTWDLESSGKVCDIRLSGWSGFYYAMQDWTWEDTYAAPAHDHYGLDWDLSGETSEVFNGNWSTYRIDFYGTNMDVYTSSDGGATWDLVGLTYYDWETGDYIEGTASVTDLIARDATDEFNVLLRVMEPVAIDNLRVVELDDLGEVELSTIVDEDFDTTDATTYFSTDKTSTYSLPDW